MNSASKQLNSRADLNIQTQPELTQSTPGSTGSAASKLCRGPSGCSHGVDFGLFPRHKPRLWSRRSGWTAPGRINPSVREYRGGDLRERFSWPIWAPENVVAVRCIWFENWRFNSTTWNAWIDNNGCIAKPSIDMRMQTSR